jgi:hypothetical protein
MEKTITEDPTKKDNVVKMTISQMIDFEDIFNKHFNKLKFAYECICNDELSEQEEAHEGFVSFFADICNEWETTCGQFEALRTKRDRS